MISNGNTRLAYLSFEENTSLVVTFHFVKTKIVYKPNGLFFSSDNLNLSLTMCAALVWSWSWQFVPHFHQVWFCCTCHCNWCQIAVTSRGIYWYWQNLKAINDISVEVKTSISFYIKYLFIYLFIYAWIKGNMKWQMINTLVNSPEHLLDRTIWKLVW